MSAPFSLKISEAGQAMVEFALVLPFLLLLTFGCLQAAIFFQHQIALSGAAFLGARAAAVRGPEAEVMARDVILSYARASGQKWLAYAERTARVELGSGLVSVTLDRNEDWYDAVTQTASMLGGSLKKSNALRQGALVQDEFNKKTSGGVGSSTAALTSLLVDYRAEAPPDLVPGLDRLSGPLKSLVGIPGFGNVVSFDVLRVALDPLEQATVANPQLPSGQVQQNSDQYLDGENETKYFKQAGKMVAGLEGAVSICSSLKAAYGVAGAEPTAGAIAQAVVSTLTPLDPLLEQAGSALAGVEPLFKKGLIP